MIAAIITADPLKIGLVFVNRISFSPNAPFMNSILSAQEIEVNKKTACVDKKVQTGIILSCQKRA